MNKGEEKGEDSVCLRNAVDQFGSTVRFLRWNNGRLGEKMVNLIIMMTIM